MNEVSKKFFVFTLLILSLFQVFLLVHKFGFLTKNIIAEDRENEVEEKVEEVNEVIPVDGGVIPERIVIDTLNLDLSVVPVEMENGTWEVLADVANYAVGTNLIKEDSGNVGIYGHAVSEVFLGLKNLKIGDIVMVYNGEKEFVYEVFQSKVVYPNQVDIFESTLEPILTLLTCDGWYSEKRYVVLAKLKVIE